jgi:hypothetical protein
MKINFKSSDIEGAVTLSVDTQVTTAGPVVNAYDTFLVEAADGASIELTSDDLAAILLGLAEGFSKGGIALGKQD